MKRLIAVWTLVASLQLCAAESDRMKEIIEKRGALLAEIHEAMKQGVKRGTCTPDEVSAAAVQLHSFRRDTAQSAADRIKWQQEILADAKREAADARNRIAIGVMTPLEVSRAEERALAAEQKLLELQGVK
jgi:hypothetical protein